MNLYSNTFNINLGRSLFYVSLLVFKDIATYINHCLHILFLVFMFRISLDNLMRLFYQELCENIQSRMRLLEWLGVQFMAISLLKKDYE